MSYEELYLMQPYLSLEVTDWVVLFIIVISVQNEIRNNDANLYLAQVMGQFK